MSGVCVFSQREVFFMSFLLIPRWNGASQIPDLTRKPRLTYALFVSALAAGIYPEWLREQARRSHSNPAATPRC